MLILIVFLREKKSRKLVQHIDIYTLEIQLKIQEKKIFSTLQDQLPKLNIQTI